MKYGGLYAGLSVICVAGAVWLRGPGWLLVWPAVSLGAVAAGYLGLGAGVCGKRADGRLAWWSVLLLPYLLGAWVIWRLARLLGPNAPYEQVAPRIWIGRRLGTGEQPPEIAAVVDLTCEFAEPEHLRSGYAYRCFPMLDGTAPPAEELIELIDEVRNLPRPLYIHCAAGRGRAAVVAAALLVAEQHSADAEQAIERLRRCRPRTFLTGAQRRAVQEAAEMLRGRGKPVAERPSAICEDSH